MLSPGGDEPDNPDPGPDLLVLGFQELDLSAEAYIYSTNVAREEAWCTAAIAALGERGPQYEKVRVPTFYTAKGLIEDS
jgi:phosphatidylinositol-bisphosphatase